MKKAARFELKKSHFGVDKRKDKRMECEKRLSIN